MSFLSKLFGESKEDKALREMMEGIRRVLDDEAYQLELLPDIMRELLSDAPAYDRDPAGTGPFGFIETNPIPVNGPIGELAYLSKLETLAGDRLLFHRIGAIDRIDVFEAVTFTGSAWFIFFVDFYHPRRSRLAPEGLKLSADTAQFSGFHNTCLDFPYDFVEMKANGAGGLSFAYIPLSRVVQQIKDRVYKRPLAHLAKLDLVKKRLTSAQTMSNSEDDED